MAWREWVGFSNKIFVILRRRGGKDGVGGYFADERGGVI